MIGGRFPAELLDEDGAFLGVFGLFRRLRRCRDRRSLTDRRRTDLPDAVHARSRASAHTSQRTPVHRTAAVGRPHRGIAAATVPHPRRPRRLGTVVAKIVYLARHPTSQWLLGGLKKFYAGRFRRRFWQGKTHFADAFFGTMTAGTTTAAMIAAFLAASRTSQLAEIGLHPGAWKRRRAQRWGRRIGSDPLAEFRPRELALILSADLEEQLAAEGCRLGRLAMYPARGHPLAGRLPFEDGTRMRRIQSHDDKPTANTHDNTIVPCADWRSASGWPWR